MFLIRSKLSITAYLFLVLYLLVGQTLGSL
jgi:hypothetical protein